MSKELSEARYVKHCIKKLGGQIMLDSKENIGMTFTVYLPNAKIDKQKK
ncbi:MAG: hypothetical protein WC220_08055 [Pedobacter sp.]|jgi:sensor histidine kinase regulating citrate/malate metabolism